MAATKFALAALALALAACGPAPKEKPAADAASASAPLRAANLDTALDACTGANQALCANKDIAALNGQVKSALGEAAAAVSPEGAQILARNQESWLAAQRAACAVAAPGALTPAQEACLKAALAERARAAAGAVEKKGPFTFQRVEINESAMQAAAAAAEDEPTSSRAIGYPRIDGDSPAIRKFNEAVKQNPRFRLDQQTEESTRYQIGHASDALVSVKFDYFDMTAHARGPNQSARAVTVNMRTGEPIGAGDVFKPGAAWQDFLARRAAQIVTAQLKGEDETAGPVTAAEIKAAVAKPEAWYVTDGALVVLLPATAFARPMEVGAREASVPWRELRPYLSPQWAGPNE